MGFKADGVLFILWLDKTDLKKRIVYIIYLTKKEYL